MIIDIYSVIESLWALERAVAMRRDLPPSCLQYIYLSWRTSLSIADARLPEELLPGHICIAVMDVKKAR